MKLVCSKSNLLTGVQTVAKAVPNKTTMSILVDESHKRILGEIPIEDDGSVHFEVPSVKAVHFQILDENRKVLQTMRSSTHVMPNEFRGCLGCHATKTTKAPQTRPAKILPFLHNKSHIASNLLSDSHANRC